MPPSLPSILTIFNNTIEAIVDDFLEHQDPPQLEPQNKEINRHNKPILKYHPPMTDDDLSVPMETPTFNDVNPELEISDGVGSVLPTIYEESSIIQEEKTTPNKKQNPMSKSPTSVRSEILKWEARSKNTDISSPMKNIKTTITNFTPLNKSEQRDNSVVNHLLLSAGIKTPQMNKIDKNEVLVDSGPNKWFDAREVPPSSRKESLINIMMHSTQFHEDEEEECFEEAPPSLIEEANVLRELNLELDLSDQYEISDYIDTSDEEGQTAAEEKAVKKPKRIPRWSTKWLETLEYQKDLIPESIFGGGFHLPQLDVIFPTSHTIPNTTPVLSKSPRVLCKKRGSSGNWSEDHASRLEIERYQRNMNQHKRVRGVFNE